MDDGLLGLCRHPMALVGIPASRSDIIAVDEDRPAFKCLLTSRSIEKVIGHC